MSLTEDITLFIITAITSGMCYEPCVMSDPVNNETKSVQTIK